VDNGSALEEDFDYDYEDDGSNDSSSEESELSPDSDAEDDDVNHNFLWGNHQPRSKITAGKNVPAINHNRMYQGHCNVETTKDVNFFGLQDEYVVSGSDCGNLFIWDRKTSQLLNILEGDNEVVNVIQAHPYEPMLAVSGLDSTVKIFSPDGRQRFDAKRGIGIEESDHSTFTHTRPRAQARDPVSESSDEDDTFTEAIHQIFGTNSNATLSTDSNDTLSGLLDSHGQVTDRNGEPSRPSRTRAGDTRTPKLHPLPSRKRMRDVYRITTENDMNRRRGGRIESSLLTRGMVALLAQRFQAQMNDMGLDVQQLVDEDGGDGALEERCVQM
jgi:nuclear receptor interaction protein